MAFDLKKAFGKRLALLLQYCKTEKFSLGLGGQKAVPVKAGYAQ